MLKVHHEDRLSQVEQDKVIDEEEEANRREEDRLAHEERQVQVDDRGDQGADHGQDKGPLGGPRGNGGAREVSGKVGLLEAVHLETAADAPRKLELDAIRADSQTVPYRRARAARRAARSLVEQ